MCGSGKSIACDVLRDSGWSYIRFGQIVIDKLRKSGKAINPENEKRMREQLREEHGMGAFAILSQEKIESALQNSNVVIDGLYSWSEYKILNERFGDDLVVVCIYASPTTRYTRLSERELDEEARMRPLTPEEAQKRDFAEIENIEKGGPIAMADFTVINEYDLDHLTNEVNNILESITSE